jgi:hypothetical protein
MTKHATTTHATKRADSELVRRLRSDRAQAQAGFLQGSIASTLLPGTSIHAPTGVAFGSYRCVTRTAVACGTYRCGTHISAPPLKAQCE